MHTIAVEALMTVGKRLPIATTDDHDHALSIAETWVRSPFVKAAIVTPAGGVPLILIHPSTIAPKPAA